MKAELHWYVAQVMTGSEQETARKLTDAGMEAIAPVQILHERRHGKWWPIRRVVFPSYVFVRTGMTPRFYYFISGLPRVIRLLGADGPEPVPDEQMEVVRLFAPGGRDFGMSQGERIDGKTVITSGPLLGLEGKIVKVNARGRRATVFQSFNLVTRTSVIKNVRAACVPDMPFWRVLLGAFRKEDKIKALESLDKVGILDKAYMRADQLSGGQQQRVALARTLTQDPHIILADEPVAALDPVTAKQVMEDFVHINQELGISILLNIHHVELALEYADRVIGIRAGKIVYDGPSKQVDQAVLDAIYGEDAVSEAAV